VIASDHKTIGDAVQAACENEMIVGVYQDFLS